MWCRPVRCEGTNNKTLKPKQYNIRFEDRGTSFRPSTLEARIKSAAICRLVDTYISPIMVREHAGEEEKRWPAQSSAVPQLPEHCCSPLMLSLPHNRGVSRFFSTPVSADQMRCGVCCVGLQTVVPVLREGPLPLVTLPLVFCSVPLAASLLLRSEAQGVLVLCCVVLCCVVLCCVVCVITRR